MAVATAKKSIKAPIIAVQKLECEFTSGCNDEARPRVYRVSDGTTTVLVMCDKHAKEV